VRIVVFYKPTVVGAVFQLVSAEFSKRLEWRCACHKAKNAK
jgi:hypothetical protein